jgi:hypothetical protein
MEDSTRLIFVYGALMRELQYPLPAKVRGYRVKGVIGQMMRNLDDEFVFLSVDYRSELLVRIAIFCASFSPIALLPSSGGPFLSFAEPCFVVLVPDADSDGDGEAFGGVQRMTGATNRIAE